MKKGFKIFCIELASCFVIALLVNDFVIDYFLFTIFGLVNLAVSILSLIAGVIVIAANNKETGKDICLAGAFLLLLGIGTCSAFPFRLNMH